MLNTRAALMTSLAMLAFAGNSLLCRLALKYTTIDAASFTSVRIVSGAVVLWLVLRAKSGSSQIGGNWLSALALFVYAAAFSFAYLTLPAGTGTLLLFGAVQTTMIGYGIWRRQPLHTLQIAGIGLAAAGLVGLLLPGLHAPPLYGSLLMLCAGVAWGVYSLRGIGARNPTAVTAGNFLRATPIAIVFSAIMAPSLTRDGAGLAYAVASGALTSGLGYTIWYIALPLLEATTAAAVQLSVPVLTAFGGIIFLGEAITLRLALAAFATLGGIALVIKGKQAPR